GRLPGFLQPHSRLDCDLVERIHRHLDVRGLDARVVRLDADLHVEIDHALDCYEDLHGGKIIAPSYLAASMSASRATAPVSNTATGLMSTEATAPSHATSASPSL